MTTRLFAVFSNPGDCEEALMEARDRGLIEDESLLKVVDKPEEEDDVPFLDTDVLVEGLIGFLGGGLAGLVGAAGLFAFAEFYNFPSASLLTIGTMGGAVFGGIIGIISGTQHEKFERDAFLEFYKPGDKVMFLSAQNESVAQRLVNVFYDHHARKVQLA